MSKKEQDKKDRKKEQKNKKNQKNISSPADSIPFEAVYESGIIALTDNEFSKSYLLPDVNLIILEESRQYALGTEWAQLVKSACAHGHAELTLITEPTDTDALAEAMLIPSASDDLNESRMQFDEVLKTFAEKSKGVPDVKALLTVVVQAVDIIEAESFFNNVELMIKDPILAISGKELQALTIYERLDILNQIYNPNDPPLCRQKTVAGKTVQSFTLENCARQGVTSKEIIAPAAIKFNASSINIGEEFAVSYAISNYPTWISADMLHNLAKIPARMLLSIHFDRISPGEANKLVKHTIKSLRDQRWSAQAQAAKQYIDVTMAGKTAEERQGEVEEIKENLKGDDASLFIITFVITVFADSMEELDKHKKQIRDFAENEDLGLRVMTLMQEPGLAASLPLGANDVVINRLATSDSVASLIPFHAKKTQQFDGVFMGINAMNDTAILYNRASGNNGNACVFGVAGFGKSFMTKMLLIQEVLRNNKDDFFIVDPDREFGLIAQKFNGKIIKFGEGHSCVNPFDINIENMDSDSGADALTLKSQAITAIMNTMIGGRFGLSPYAETIVDRCVKNIYEKHIAYLQRVGKSFDQMNVPTLKDFYSELIKQPEDEAQNLALALERYTLGTVKVFSGRTNINLDNRIIVFDTQSAGSGLKTLTTQVLFEFIWNKMIENSHQNKRTWIYIDEGHTLLESEASGQYIAKLWRQARKWGGIPTLITQNVDDVINKPEFKVVLDNTVMTIMLQQSDTNAKILSKMFNLSPMEAKSLIPHEPGRGLMRIGADSIPFSSRFSSDNEFYKLMSTKPDERLYY